MSYSLPYTKNILWFTFSNFEFFDNETPFQKSSEYVNDDLPKAKKTKKDYNDQHKQKKIDRQTNLKQGHQKQNNSRRGFTNNTTSDQMAPPNNVNQQDFHMKTAPLHPRVVAPVWDRRVITPRSLD